MTNKIPPYNTGKLRIGSMYEPPRYNNMTEDESRLQNALLGMPDTTDIQREKAAWGVILFVAIILLLVIYAPR
jgi:hypothetical protein